jgi:hypothetical protein
MLHVSHITPGNGLYDDGHIAAQCSIPILPTFNPLQAELNSSSDLKEATFQIEAANSSYNIRVPSTF